MILFNVIRYLKANGISMTINEAFDRVGSNMSSLLFILGRTDINISSSARIRGLSHIEIGMSFTAGRYLRLEAVSKYGKINYTPSIVIGNNVVINDFVHIAATNYIQIGNNVLMASNIYISDHSHGLYSGNKQTSPMVPPGERTITNNKKIIIEDNVWIGEMVSILPGASIGLGSIIGANSVVTSNIPKFSIAVGNPAKVIKQYDTELEQWVSI